MRTSNSYNAGRSLSARPQAGMTLVEVVMSLLVSAVAVSCMVSGYVFSINSAERSAFSLAATARAVERLEETRSAKWDTSVYPPIDQLVSSNFPNKTVDLDVSADGTAFTRAVVRTDIFTVSAEPPLRGIRVDCVWSFRGGQKITNSVETVRSPD